MPRLPQLLALLLAIPVSGCMTEDTQRYNGVTQSAGDAIAANTVMQIVDPWPYGVQDTDLEVPAARPEPAEVHDDDAALSPVTRN